MARAGRPLKVPSELIYIDSYVEENDTEGIDGLIDLHGVDCYDQDKRTFLILSAAKGNILILNYLITKDANLNFQDKIGYTALHFAAQNKQVKILDLLIKQGADINVRDIHGNSPIWTAIINAKEDFSIVTKLLKSSADVLTENNYGKSPSDMWKIKFDSNINSLLKE